MLDEFAGQIEGDFAHYYTGQDAYLGNLWKPETRLTPRRVRALLDRLPTDSATLTAMRDQLTDEQYKKLVSQHSGTGHGPLSRGDLIHIDILDQLRWIEYGLYRAQGGKPRKPDPTPRPGVPDKRKNTTVVPLNDAGLDYLQKLRNRRG